jgi:branched-chain amino acid transport system permease protein
MEQFLGYLLPGVMRGCVYTIIALGFIVIYRTTGVLNFAQGELFLLGAYGVYFAIAQAGLPIYIGIPLVFIVLGLLGTAIERVALRPLVGQPILGIILMTLGLSVFIRGMVVLIWSDIILPVPTIFGSGGVSFLGVTLPSQYLWFAGISICISVVLFSFFGRSSIGLQMTAVADRIQLAQTCGVSVNRVTAAAWVIACIITGAGGYMLCTITGVYPLMGELGLRSLAVVLAGGMESIGGAMIMGPVVGAIEFVLSGYLDPYVGGGLRDVVAFAVLIVFLVFRPQGLFGWKIIERV